MRSSPSRSSVGDGFGGQVDFRDMRVARHREALKSCCWLRLYIYIYIHIHISTGNLWLLRHHCFSMFSSVMAPLMFGSCSPPVFHDLTSECSPGSTATGQIGQHQKLTRMQRTGDGQNVYIWYICCCFNQYKQRRWRWRDPKMPVRVLAILSKDPKMPAPEEWFGRCIRSKIARVAQQLVGSAEFCLTKPTQYNN